MAKTTIPEANPKTFIHHTVTVKTRGAMEALRRSFENANNSLFLASVIVRAYNEEIADELEEFISNEMDSLNDRLDAQIGHFKSEIEENGVVLETEREPVEMALSLRTPTAIQFCNLLVKLDQCLELLEDTWYAGLTNNKRHREQMYNWRQQFIKTFNRIRTNTEKRFKESKQGLDDETLDASRAEAKTKVEASNAGQSEAA
jgi:hypothetical protein